MPGTEIHKPKILIVDGELGILKLLAYGLAIYGLEVLTADNSGKAVEMYECFRSEIELVLLDVPKLRRDGIQTLIDLQRIDPIIPVAFMSATPLDLTTTELLGLGVVRVIPKPFQSLKHLAEILKELIEKRNQTDGR